MLEKQEAEPVAVVQAGHDGLTNEKPKALYLMHEEYFLELHYKI